MLSGDLPGWMYCSRAVAAAVGVILKIQVDILAKVLYVPVLLDEFDFGKTIFEFETTS